MHAPLVILGPQRAEPNLRQVLEKLGVGGPIAAITAGWRHDEAELADLEAAVGPVVPIPLYSWFEQAPIQAPEVHRVYHERQQRIQRFKALYRLRVHAALRTVRDLLRMAPSDPELVLQQVDRASDVVRSIDGEVIASVDEVRGAYHSLADRFENDWIRERRDEARQRIKEAGVVLVAGGHVAVLRNRMLFFGVEHPLRSHLAAKAPVICWGAGGMVMTEKIVLFYDDPPEGPAEAEVLDHGLGFIDNLVLFPHARRRLRLDDSERVAALARRFSPEACLGLEQGAWVSRVDGRWVNHGARGSAFALMRDGAVRALEQA